MKNTGFGTAKGTPQVSAPLLDDRLPALQHYEVLEKIAEGSMASVYRARQCATERIVAVKILSPTIATNPVLLKRFEQEFRVAREFRHPNLVQTLDYGQEGQTVFIVMEFVDGEDLWQRIEQAGRLPEDEAIRLILQVAEGLQEAHKHGIIHRDVKPDNILLTADGQAKLADLGLAKDLESDSDLTRARSGLGTPNFIAPEQFGDARHAGVRCDIYSLGATLYMAVTGQLPFHAPTLGSIFKKKHNNDLVPARQLVPGLSERLDRVIQRAVHANPEQRFASCREFIKALLGESNGPGPALAAEAPAADDRGAPVKIRAGERRCSVRYHFNAETACNVGTSIHPDDPEAQDNWTGTVQDISTNGMRLVLRRRFEPGSTLAVELKSQDRQFTRRLQFRVAWVKRASAGQWSLGCTFLQRLGRDELRKLL